MSDPVPAYPFDPTGLEVSNKIVERQSVFSKDWKDYHMVIPKYAPFFLTNLTIRLVDEDRMLVEGEDYLLTHVFSDASRATAKEIYGSVTFLDNRLAGEIELTYQTLGGEWLIKETDAVRILSNKLINPRITTWEQVIDVPDRFPTINHEWDLIDMVGMSDVRESIDFVREAVQQRPDSTALLRAHTNNYTNPHGVTKSQIGLGLVENHPIASEEDALVGIRDDCYMTPSKTLSLVKRYAIQSDKEYYTKQEVEDLVNNLQAQIDQLNSST